MRKSIKMLIALLTLYPAVNLFGQDKLVEGFAAVAPFVNDQTVAVVSIDLSRIDLPALEKQIIDPLCHSDAQRITASVMSDKLSRISQDLREEGVRYVYLIGSLQFLPLNPARQENTRRPYGPLDQCMFIVVPGMQGTSHAQMQMILNNLQMPASEGYRMYKTGPAMRETKYGTIVATEDMLDKWSAIEPQPRPEFEKALSAAGDHPICAAIAPTPVMARAAEEILRDPLPGSSEPIGRVLARGFRWVGIGFQPNVEKFSSDVVIQSANAEAARQLGEVLQQLTAQVLARQVANADSAASGATTAVAAAPLVSLVPVAKGDQLVLALNGDRAQGFVTFAQHAFADAMRTTWRRQSMSNMKQIALAVLNYEDTHREMPDHAIRDKDGKPLLSWRVMLLPQMEQSGLYKQFHLDEPWDSEHNRKLIERMPDIYRSPDTADSQPGRTRYLAVVGEHCIFPPDHPIKMKEISDGTSKTIMVVEADPDHSVIWTKPDDFEVDQKNPTRGLASDGRLFNAVFADGHVEVFEATIDPKKLWALFTRDGGENIQP
jgi:prepilin-type processing-associated H-X9-DG protein